ncbi:MAG: hypothetical protein JO168_14570 [Solirubrobacterales bacterium]|nr:hypothetical protein [Solirubrobacterales bacterium]MBV9717328.1 hypothetical protein [Solirubrobacterales bacterium]
MGAELVGIMVVLDSDAEASGRIPALEQVANRPIADHVLSALDAAGVTEVLVLCPAARAAEIRDCLGCERAGGAPLRYVEDPGPFELRRALQLAADSIGSAPCIVHLAGGLLSEPLSPFVERVVRGAADVVLFVHQSEAADGHLSPATQEMLHLAELDPDRAALRLAGVWLFAGAALSRACAAPGRSLSGGDLPSVAEQITADGGNVQVALVDAWRRYTGAPLDRLELNRIALDRLESDPRRPSNNGNLIEGRVWIHERASVRASVLVGPAVIGPGARIADAYIGPYTSIGAGARVEGAEIERSIISPGASVLHIGGRLAASVVGRDARIFRDFSLPRALRLRVGDGTEVALS